MDVRTVAIYEARAREWQTRRGDATDGIGQRLRAAVGPGLVADLGCGTGRYLPELGAPVVAMDATAAMLEIAALHRYPLVRGDLEALPFATGSLSGAFARHSYLHVRKDRLPAALAELHRALVPGGRVLMTLIGGEYEGNDLPGDDFPGRFFSCWGADELRSVLSGVGFVDIAIEQNNSRSDLLVTARN